MRRVCVLKRSNTPRLHVRKRQHIKKTTLEDDEEKEEEEGQVQTTVSDTAKASQSRNPKVIEQRAHKAAQKERNGTVLPLSDDVLSSMTRSFESRPMEGEQEHAGDLEVFWNWSIDPHSAALFYWKAAVTMAVIYNCAVVILRSAFAEVRDEGVFTVLDLVCDAIYVLDILFESKTSFLSDGCLVRDARQMFRHYKGKRQFIHDIVSVFPVHTLVLQSAYVCDMFQVAEFEMLTFWKYFEVYQPLLRLNRLLKCHAMDKFFQQTESRTNNPNLLRAFKLSLHLGLVIHWIACLYYMLSECEGLGTNDWVYPLEPNVTRFSRKYILCMFWSTMTLTTIGERPPPITDLEYIFTGFTFLIGVFVFAAVVGNVGDVISNMNAARRDFQARMDQIKFYMNHRNVPEHLQNQIKRWAEYTWDRTKAIDEPNAMQFLPDRLRTEVAIHVHLNILKKVSIFENCEEGLLHELVLKLRPQIFSPGDYICRIGEIGRDLYIINHGKVEILFPDTEAGDMIQIAVMHPGNFFGEISLLKLDDGQNKRTADVRSIGFSELLCLSRRDLIMALTEYPEAKQILEEYARKRFNNTKKLTPPDTEDSRNVSPRVSCVSMSNKRTARQIFSQVMKQEGFAHLLAGANKSAELAEIRAIVEELRTSKNEHAEDSLLCLQKKVEELERIVSDKNLELQESRAQVFYLEQIIKKLGDSHTTPQFTQLSSSSGKATSEKGTDFLLKDPTIHTRPCNMSVGELAPNNKNANGNYLFSVKDLGKPPENLVKTLNNFCAQRRQLFRETVQKNIGSKEKLDSSSCTDSSAGSLASLQHENGVHGARNNICVMNTASSGNSPPYSFLSSRSQRLPSSLYTSCIDHNLKAYFQHPAALYDSPLSNSHSIAGTSGSFLVRNLSEFGNSSKIAPQRCNVATQNKHLDRNLASTYRTFSSLTTKQCQPTPVVSDSSATKCRLRNVRCSLAPNMEDHMNRYKSNIAVTGRGRRCFSVGSSPKRLWENISQRSMNNTGVTSSKENKFHTSYK